MSGSDYPRGGLRLLIVPAGQLVGALLASLLLCTCSGDFDRPRPLVFGEDSTFGVPSALVEPTQSKFAFTDAEKRMRELAYPLLLPPDGGGWWELVPVDLSYVAVMADQGPPYDVQAYGTGLMTIPARSEVERYTQLIDAIADDMSRIDRFDATARRVLDGDHERLHNLSGVTGLTEAESNSARARVAENARIIKRVGVCLHLRAAAYRYAAQRLAIAVPSNLLSEVDRKLATYERRINPFDVASDATNDRRGAGNLRY
jgi:hypothetical protein